MRLTTLTLHPALDRLLDTQGIQLGGLFDVQVRAIIPAGKGVNTARVLRRLMQSSIHAAIWLGQAEAPAFNRFLKAERITPRICPRPHSTRWGVTLLESNRRETHFKERMPAPDRKEGQALLRFLSRIQTDAMVVCGSAPPGTPVRLLRRTMQLLRKRCPLLVVDSNGPLLAEAGRVGCDGLKGNADEIGAWLGLARPWDPARRAHRRLLRERLCMPGAPKSVLITLGARGAALASGQRQWVARPPRIRRASVVSPTGCGDAATAGWLWAMADRAEWALALRRAVACGTAKLLHADPGAVHPKTVRRLVRITKAVECFGHYC